MRYVKGKDFDIQRTIFALSFLWKPSSTVPSTPIFHALQIRNWKFALRFKGELIAIWWREWEKEKGEKMHSFNRGIHRWKIENVVPRLILRTFATISTICESFTEILWYSLSLSISHVLPTRITKIKKVQKVYRAKPRFSIFSLFYRRRRRKRNRIERQVVTNRNKPRDATSTSDIV